LKSGTYPEISFNLEMDFSHNLEDGFFLKLEGRNFAIPIRVQLKLNKIINPISDLRQFSHKIEKPPNIPIGAEKQGEKEGGRESG
jgi:hypothetical protein